MAETSASTTGGQAASFIGDIIPIGQLTGFGLNAMAASKAHDRQKNWATRSATYQRINLLDAGINPILAAGSIGPGQAKVPQASGTGSAGTTAGQVRALNAQARLTNAQAVHSELGVPRAVNLNTFDKSPAGMVDAERSRINASSPQTVTAGAIRAFNSAKDAASGIFDKWVRPGVESMQIPLHRPRIGKRPTRAEPAPPNWQRPDW